MFWMIVTRIFCKTEILRDFLCTLKAGIFSMKKVFSPFIGTTYSTESTSAFTNGEETTDSIISKMLSNVSCLVFDRSSVMKKSNTLFYVIESVVSSPFVKAEADSVEYVVLCLKRYVRLH
jgi:hypothetical protein